MSDQLDVELKHNSRLALGIIHKVTESVQHSMPELAELFPFVQGGPECWVCAGNGWLAATVRDRRGPGLMPAIGDFPPERLTALKALVEPFSAKTPEEITAILNSDWLSKSCFTYVGPYSNGRFSSEHLNNHLFHWLNNTVLPDVLEKNAARVLRAIPQPPSFNFQKIAEALWALEGIVEETRDGQTDLTCRQGTAFALENVGLVTCHHVLTGRTIAFRADDHEKKFPVAVKCASESSDLAVLHIDAPLRGTLSAGTADNLKLMDHILVAGFPNYRVHDTPRFCPGLVSAFRTVRGVQRLLTNAPIIAGGSGGPILAGDNEVVGVAVTGADRMEQAHETEDHGVIPIDRILDLWQTHRSKA